MPRYDLDTNTVGELLADPDVVALMERHRPGLAASSDVRSVAHLTVNQALGEALRYASQEEVQRARAELESL